jgi:phosphoribosyl 1,2-cyclic phosphodiesterase
MPEAIILGSGTSTGVPIIGKSYPAEYLANPKNHRLRSSLLLRGDKGDVLVDAGPDARQQLLGAQVSSIECVLVTHTHADHIMGMDDLRAFCLGTKEPVRVIAASSPTRLAISRQGFSSRDSAWKSRQTRSMQQAWTSRSSGLIMDR